MSPISISWIPLGSDDESAVLVSAVAPGDARAIGRPTPDDLEPLRPTIRQKDATGFMVVLGRVKLGSVLRFVPDSVMTVFSHAVGPSILIYVACDSKGVEVRTAVYEDGWPASEPAGGMS